jgi:aerobic-type carbon monoxide dehydrogenase small subunit (CoxS/CutS family)
MATTELWVNGERREIDGEEEMPLLWVLRDLLGLTGTKYGCGEGVCGACTVIEDGVAVRACQVPLSAAAGKGYTTIEGLAAGSAGLHPVQRAWIDDQAMQCGYCQPGVLLEVAAHFDRSPGASAEELEEVASSHLCRCGSYPRIRRALRRVAGGAGGR